MFVLARCHVTMQIVLELGTVANEMIEQLCWPSSWFWGNVFRVNGLLDLAFMFLALLVCGLVV